MLRIGVLDIKCGGRRPPWPLPTAPLRYAGGGEQYTSLTHLDVERPWTISFALSPSAAIWRILRVSSGPSLNDTDIGGRSQKLGGLSPMKQTFLSGWILFKQNLSHGREITVNGCSSPLAGRDSRTLAATRMQNVDLHMTISRAILPIDKYPTKKRVVVTLASCLSMIFSENRFPLFGIML